MYRKELSTLNVYKLGLLSYEAGQAYQEHFHKLVLTGQRGPCLLMLEHTPVITFGKSASAGFLKASKEALRTSGIDLCLSDRGGQLTAHTPGQLVVYPIIPLREYGLGVKSYINLLEQSVINLLASWGVLCKRDPEYPGVWYGNSKICALGVRIKDRVSMHGLALNVNADLRIFSHIVPCGIEGRSVVNLESLIHRKILVSDVAKRLAKELGQLMNLDLKNMPHEAVPKRTSGSKILAQREG
ncbi:MAG: lipoyl(octanoyl) transferase LipB [Oligoflexales bacterium]|nr:lipoyl(octanoyl) transferase LipB [Oligoflexales bacterium]